jgi:hypothetical protein
MGEEKDVSEEYERGEAAYISLRHQAVKDG